MEGICNAFFLLLFEGEKNLHSKEKLLKCRAFFPVMKLSSLVHRLVASAMMLAATPIFAYSLSEQIATSGYQSGDAFELSFVIGGISSDSDYTQTWSIVTLDTGYYLIAQKDMYIGLSSRSNSMRNGSDEDPRQWVESELKGDVNTYTSDGYLYSWLSRDKGGYVSSMAGMLGMRVTISSNGTDSSTISFDCADRSSVVTLNNVVLDANDIVINDGVSFGGRLNCNETDLGFGGNWITIAPGECYRSASLSDYSVVENAGTLEMLGNVWRAHIINSEGAVVKVLSESGTDAVSIENHEGAFSWSASVAQDGEKTVITAGESAELKGDVTVHAGAILRNAYRADYYDTGWGDDYSEAPERVFKVENGGTLDLYGGESYYHVVLEEGATLANTGDDISYTWKGLPVVDLKGDATAQADYDFGMVGASFGKVALNLNGHTLTKTGESTFYLCHATADAGIIDVQEGTLALRVGIADSYSTPKEVSDLSQTDIRVAAGAVFEVEGMNPKYVTDSTIQTHKVQSISGAGTVQLLKWAKLNVESAQITFQAGNDITAVMSGVSVNANGIQGNVLGASMKDVWMLHPLDAASIADVQMQNVHFSADLATLTLTNVSFDEACSFSVGEEGRIVLSDAVVNISLPEELGEGGIYTVDLSELFQCSVEGELTFSLDTEALLTAGYTGVQVDLGSSATEDYTGLTVYMNGASYDGMEGNVAGFTLTVPEPATGALSLLALAAMAARRRRA